LIVVVERKGTRWREERSGPRYERMLEKEMKPRGERWGSFLMGDRLIE